MMNWILSSFVFNSDNEELEQVEKELVSNLCASGYNCVWRWSKLQVLVAAF